jgi:GYF domain 2
MNYFISRGGQQYGPYAAPDVQRYLEQGSIQYSDLARTETMSEWLPLSQLLQSGQSLPMNPASPANPMVSGSPRGAGPIPPSLHWALVLLLSMITGIFHYIWMFIQAGFIKKIDPQSKAMMFYVLGLVTNLVAAGVGILLLVIVQGLNHPDSPSGVAAGPLALMSLIFCVGAGLLIAGIFSVRSSMVRYYNSVEPIDLRLSGVMTFFFNVLYFQYHFSRIAKWKETGIIYPQ